MGKPKGIVEIATLCGGLFKLCVGDCHIDRRDGGHLRIYPTRENVHGFAELNFEELQALGMAIRLSIGALEYALAQNGIPIGHVNVQVNGNWSILYGKGKPLFCVHIYGRSEDSVKQPYGEALRFPAPRKHPEFYENNEPVNEKDISLMREYIQQNG